MQLCVLDTTRHAAFNKLETKLPNTLHCTLRDTLWRTLLIALDCTFPACLTYGPKQALKSLPSTPPCTFSSTLPRMLTRTLPIVLEGTLPACLTLRSRVSSQDALKHTPEHALKHTPEHALKHTPDCARLYTPSLLDLRSQVSSEDAPKYITSKLPSTSPSTYSSTPPAYSQGCSQLHSMAHY